MPYISQSGHENNFISENSAWEKDIKRWFHQKVHSFAPLCPSTSTCYFWIERFRLHHSEGKKLFQVEIQTCCSTWSGFSSLNTFCTRLYFWSGSGTRFGAIQTSHSVMENIAHLSQIGFQAKCWCWSTQTLYIVNMMIIDHKQKSKILLGFDLPVFQNMGGNFCRYHLSMILTRYDSKMTQHPIRWH